MSRFVLPLLASKTRHTLLSKSTIQATELCKGAAIRGIALDAEF